MKCNSKFVSENVRSGQEFSRTETPFLKRQMLFFIFRRHVPSSFFFMPTASHSYFRILTRSFQLEFPVPLNSSPTLPLWNLLLHFTAVFFCFSLLTSRSEYGNISDVVRKRSHGSVGRTHWSSYQTAGSLVSQVTGPLVDKTDKRRKLK